MSERWYVTCMGRTLGPMTREHLLELLVSGQVGVNEFVWPDGSDVQMAVQSYLDMVRNGTLNGWLERMQVTAPPPPPVSPMPVQRAPDRWFHEQATGMRGPFTLEQLQQMALQGSIRPTDNVWREGPNAMDLYVARSVLDFPAAPPTPVSSAPAAPPRPRARPKTPASGQSTPSWLSDVVPDEPAPPAASGGGGVPDWLGDVEQESKPAPAAPPARTRNTELPKKTTVSNPPPVKASIPLDWLDDIRQIEQSLRPAAAPEAPKAPPPAPARAVPAAPAPTKATPQPPAPKPDNTGYDPETGQILDPVAYARWQKEEQQRRQEEVAQQPSRSIYEVFLEARQHLQEWVNAEENRPLIVAGSVDAITKSPAIQAHLQAYEGYGKVMREKLHKHLEFLVDNRRKFYADFAGKA